MVVLGYIWISAHNHFTQSLNGQVGLDRKPAHHSDSHATPTDQYLHAPLSLLNSNGQRQPIEITLTTTLTSPMLLLIM
jgi:hypothetical protein